MADRKSNRPTYEERFWARVRNGDGCWEWMLARNHNGYGKFGAQGERAHRAAWKLTNGPIPDGLLVLHRCDNRACCRPDHLFLGTPADNMRDMALKGRCSKVGNPSMRANMTAELIRAIRARCTAGEQSKQIAKALGVHRNTVGRIARGESYRRIA